MQTCPGAGQDGTTFGSFSAWRALRALWACVTLCSPVKTNN